MVSDITENVVLFDWLTFTTRAYSVPLLIEDLGLSHVQWTDFPGHGRYGYQDRMQFGNINIMYNGSENMGVCCEMSGQGCRNFEDHTTLANKWDDLIYFVLSDDVHITRLDVAFDDHTGLLDIDTIYNDSLARNYISRLRCGKAEISWKTDSPVTGKSITFGSRASDVLIRIYDKAAERGFTDGRHWVRVELQLRQDRSRAFLELTNTMSYGEAFSGVCLNYLRFVEPAASDTNKSRWVMTEYWSKFLESASRIRLYVAPGGEYNVAKLYENVVNRNGNQIDCFIQIYGVDALVEALRHRKCKQNPKFELLKRQHDAHIEKIADSVKLAFELGETDTPAWGFSCEVENKLSDGFSRLYDVDSDNPFSVTQHYACCGADQVSLPL